MFMTFNADHNKCFLSPKISTSEWFLKDCVTLKTGVMAAENPTLPSQNRLHLKIFRKKTVTIPQISTCFSWLFMVRLVTTHICPYLRVQDTHSKEQPIGEQQEDCEQPQQGAEHCYPGQGGSTRTRKQRPASQQQNEKLECQREKQALTGSTTSLASAPATSAGAATGRIRGLSEPAGPGRGWGPKEGSVHSSISLLDLLSLSRSQPNPLETSCGLMFQWPL